MKDLTSWRLESVKPFLPSLPTRKPISTIDKRFIKAPLPYKWVTSAACLGGKALHTAMAIRFLVGIQQKTTVKVTHKTLKEFGVSTKTSYATLQRLEEKGLITVARHKGRSPLITVIEEL